MCYVVIIWREESFVTGSAFIQETLITHIQNTGSQHLTRSRKQTVNPGLGVSKVEIMLEWPRRRCPVVPSEMEEMENQRKFDLPLMWPCTVLKQWPSPKTLSLCKLCSDATATFYLIGVFTFSLPMYTYLDQVRRALLPSALAHTIHFSY